MSPRKRRILRLRAVEDRSGLKRDAIYKQAREGKFPRPVKLTEHASGWFEDEIDLWVEQRERAPVKRLGVKRADPTAAVA